MNEKEIQELRVSIRERQKYICFFCEKELLESFSFSVHHIVPDSFGGELSLENCICVCKDCHNKLEILNRRMIVGLFNNILKQYGHDKKFLDKSLGNILNKIKKNKSEDKK